MPPRAGSRKSAGVTTTGSMQLYDTPISRWAGPRRGLVLLYSPHYEQFSPVYVLSPRGTILGRDPSADICIPWRAVSREHARIHEKDGRLVLSDLGGRNGTIVNGEFVHEIALQHLDEVRVGDVIFKYVEDDADNYARYRIDGALIEDPATGAARPPSGVSQIIGGYQVQRLAAALRSVASSALTVMILGESGTGKEVFARQLHDWSGRRGQFQAVNCAAIPATLIEGELFGHRRGAFSGADKDRLGLIRAAHEGSLFLDEIGDMPLEAQAKLLRVLQSKEVVPVGANQPERVDVRVVCATHRDLKELQKDGRFRADLFARLNEYSLLLPPLRERKEDIFTLCRALSARHGAPAFSVSLPCMAGLLHYDFPFNVRELEALIKRWIATTGGAELDVEHLTDEIKERMKTYGVRGTKEAEQPAIPPKAERDDGDAPSEQELRRLLTESRGNVAAIGRLFGKDRVQVYRWMKRYKIDIDEYR